MGLEVSFEGVHTVRQDLTSDGSEFQVCDAMRSLSAIAELLVLSGPFILSVLFDLFVCALPVFILLLLFITINKLLLLLLA